MFGSIGEDGVVLLEAALSLRAEAAGTIGSDSERSNVAGAVADRGGEGGGAECAAVEAKLSGWSPEPERAGEATLSEGSE